MVAAGRSSPSRLNVARRRLASARAWPVQRLPSPPPKLPWTLTTPPCRPPSQAPPTSPRRPSPRARWRLCDLRLRADCCSSWTRYAATRRSAAAEACLGAWRCMQATPSRSAAPDSRTVPQSQGGPVSPVGLARRRRRSTRAGRGRGARRPPRCHCPPRPSHTGGMRCSRSRVARSAQPLRAPLPARASPAFGLPRGVSLRRRRSSRRSARALAGRRMEWALARQRTSRRRWR
mmetsp:Transcript_4615/g.12118  ORF Transcript_4615/g.12118 Transcript_4615/m.12118 type:complete len:233 (+) Transcript_4615:681-1379(+)